MGTLLFIFERYMKEKLKEHIRQIVSITDADLDHVVNHFQEKKLRKNQFLIQKDDFVTADHWVFDGLAKAYILDATGKEYILQFAMEDWWITDYKAYFNKTRAEIWVECLEPTTVLTLTLENRNKICNEIHPMANFFRIKGNRGYVALQQRILSLLQTTAQERYTELLTKYPSLFQRVSKTQIAAYLGVSRETLSRFRS